MLGSMTTPEQKVSHLFSILHSAASFPYIGEPVSQLEHSLQCAHLAASSSPKSDDETIIAALLHDIGQFIPSEDIQQLLGEKKGRIQNMLINTSETNADKVPQTNSVGRISHEDLGGEYLTALGFPSKVAKLVQAHVAAKRYLCAVDPEYHDLLSDASKQSLIFQGGPMKGTEKDDFASSPWCEDMCRLRKWDDEAKSVGLEVPELDSYHAMMIKVLESAQ
jgi:putative nucleotidyltransferase with HDIG domain